MPRAAGLGMRMLALLRKMAVRKGWNNGLTVLWVEGLEIVDLLGHDVMELEDGVGVLEDHLGLRLDRLGVGDHGLFFSDLLGRALVKLRLAFDLPELCQGLHCGTLLLHVLLYCEIGF